MTDQKSLDEVLDMLRSQRTAMVTTLDGDKLVSRPMAPMHVDDDGALWFFTDAEADKTDQVSDDPHTNVTFSHGDFLSVSGTAKLVRDEAKQQELWNDIVEAWMQCEPTDQRVRLLKVTPDSIAYWTKPNTVASLFGLAKAKVTDQQPDLGEHGVVEA